MLSIGEIIRVNREAQNISQDTLSQGICSVSNLSRIENGVQIPSRITYEALMQRLGLPPEMYPSFLNDRELEMFRLKHQINKKFIAGQYAEAEALLNKMCEEPKPERLYKQFVIYARAVLLRETGGDPAVFLGEMKKAVAMSMKDFQPQNILRYVLTRDELNMLNNLAYSYHCVGDEDSNIEVLYALKEYIEKKVADTEGISPVYTTVLYNLSKWVGLKGGYNEVIKLCDIGIESCIEYGRYLAFAGLLFNKGYALVMLNRKEDARKHIQESYYIGRARNNTEMCEIIKTFAAENGIEI